MEVQVVDDAANEVHDGGSDEESDGKAREVRSTLCEKASIHLGLKLVILVG